MSATEAAKLAGKQERQPDGSGVLRGERRYIDNGSSEHGKYGYALLAD